MVTWKKDTNNQFKLEWPPNWKSWTLLAKVYCTKFTNLIGEVIATDLVYYNLMMFIF
jgi:hypothetical protein